MNSIENFLIRGTVSEILSEDRLIGPSRTQRSLIITLMLNFRINGFELLISLRITYLQMFIYMSAISLSFTNHESIFYNDHRLEKKWIENSTKWNTVPHQYSCTAVPKRMNWFAFSKWSSMKMIVIRTDIKVIFLQTRRYLSNIITQKGLTHKKSATKNELLADKIIRYPAMSSILLFNLSTLRTRFLVPLMLSHI